MAEFTHLSLSVWDTTDYQWRDVPATKLASLFGSDKDPNLGNECLRYTAPKQPSRSSPAPVTSEEELPGSCSRKPVVLHAVSVYAFQYVSGQHQRLGTVGAAILSSNITREYSILLYSSQQKHFTSARIHPEFVFTVQRGLYCSFYDDHRQNWSLRFGSQAALVDFCKVVCLAKKRSEPCWDGVVAQDLSVGDGRAAETGDAVFVAFTGWLWQEHDIGQRFDCNHGNVKTLRLRLGAGKAIKGLEDGLLGVRPGGRRLLVVPPSQAYGSSGIPDYVPAHSTLVFDAEVRKVKAPKVKQVTFPPHHGSDRGAEPAQLMDGCTRDTHSRCSAHQRCPTQSAHGTATAHSTSVAKVGQQSLSFTSASPQHNQREQSASSVMDSSQQLSSHASPGHLGSAHCQTIPVCPTLSVPYHTSIKNNITSLLVMETRQQNAEIRLALEKVTDQVDLLSSKVDSFQKHTESVVSMETGVIVQSVESIIQENDHLRSEMVEKDARIKDQNVKIGELIHEIQRYVERDHVIQHQNKAEAEAEGSSRSSRADLLEAQLSSVLLDNRRHEARIRALQTQLAGLKEEAELLRLQHQTERQRREDAESKVSRLEREMTRSSTEKGRTTAPGGEDAAVTRDGR